MIEAGDFSAAMADLTSPGRGTGLRGSSRRISCKKAPPGGWRTSGRGSPTTRCRTPKRARGGFPQPIRRGLGLGEPGGHPRGGTRGDEIVFFNRSGFNRSPGKGTLFWFVDQLVA
jgi:sulfoquinovosidase